MRCWAVEEPGPLAGGPVRAAVRPRPVPGAGEVLLEVEACGVCRTDLHLAEGDLAPRRSTVVPGHQIVGRVRERGPGAARFEVGDRVGGAWLRSTCGSCDWCRTGRENLCPSSTYTGWDADGGFAEYAVVPERFGYRLSTSVPAAELAPLLCGGIIGYRALVRSHLPPGGRLGLYGFGSSAHITAQVALAQGAELFVMTRGERARALARETGAAWVGSEAARPPELLDSAIVFAPAGELVPVALEALRPGGTLALAGIHLSAVPSLDYERHLFHERDLRTVTSSTRRDGEELLALASRLGVRPHVTCYPLGEADRALADLAAGRFSGSGVLLAG
ncbi:zinc-dependent alcohol dehydrogenase family protein [Nocardioides pyridinolyticus]